MAAGHPAATVLRARLSFLRVVALAPSPADLGLVFAALARRRVRGDEGCDRRPTLIQDGVAPRERRAVSHDDLERLEAQA